MKVIGKIEITDYIAAQWVHMRPRKMMRIVLYCLLALIGFVYSMIIKDSVIQGEYASFFWILTLCIGYFIIHFGWLFPMNARKMYRQHVALQKPFEVDISPEYFHIHHEEGDSQTKWTDFHKWKEGKKLFLIYRSDNLFHMLPKRCFQTPEDIDSLRNILRDNLGKEAT